MFKIKTRVKITRHVAKGCGKYNDGMCGIGARGM